MEPFEIPPSTGNRVNFPSENCGNSANVTSGWFGELREEQGSRRTDHTGPKTRNSDG